MDSRHKMETNTDEDDQSKRQCYRCENCCLSFTDIRSLDDHLKKSCLNISVTSKNETVFDSCMDTLRSAEIDSFNVLMNAREEANNSVKRYLETLERKKNAEQSRTKRTLHSVGPSEEHSFMSDIVEGTFQELQFSLNEFQLLGEVVDQALRQLKDLNSLAASAASKVHYAYSKAVQASREKLKYTVLIQETDTILQDIRIDLKSRHGVLIELQKGVADLENTISGIYKDYSKKDLLRTTVNESGRDPTQNVTKRKSKDEQMDVAMENLDEQRPSTSGIHENEPDLMPEKNKKRVSCARRLSFS